GPRRYGVGRKALRAGVGGQGAGAPRPFRTTGRRRPAPGGGDAAALGRAGGPGAGGVGGGGRLLHRQDGQVRRLDRRAALADVADAAVAGGDAAGGGRAGPPAVGPGPGAGAASAVGGVGRLPGLEPLAASLDL